MNEDYAKFLADLERFCVERGYEIAGTCEAESIYGEITVVKIGDEPRWRDWEKHKFNFDPPNPEVWLA